MKRHLPGLHCQPQDHNNLPAGLYLVRVEAASYRYHPQKPFLRLRFAILEPAEQAGEPFAARLYCTPKALWKLGWFLREFGYDSELLGQDEVDEKAVVGLRGVVQLSHTQLNGRSYLNLEGFAPAAQWEALSGVAVPETQEVNDDL